MISFIIHIDKSFSLQLRYTNKFKCCIGYTSYLRVGDSLKFIIISKTNHSRKNTDKGAVS